MPRAQPLIPRVLSRRSKQVCDQNERGVAYRYYVEGAASTSMPALIGAHWFQWMDEPVTGRSENYNIGLVDVTDRPYDEMMLLCRLRTNDYQPRMQGRSRRSVKSPGSSKLPAMPNLFCGARAGLHRPVVEFVRGLQVSTEPCRSKCTLWPVWHCPPPRICGTRSIRPCRQTHRTTCRTVCRVVSEIQSERQLNGSRRSPLGVLDGANDAEGARVSGHIRRAQVDVVRQIAEGAFET